MKKIILAIAAVVVIFTACKKNYITGGTAEDVNKYSNTTTYDALKDNPLYDTLVRLIDTAGLKDQINSQGFTLFAPSDYSVLNYLTARTLYVQATINASAKFGLDSLFYYLRNNIKGTRDSMLMYLVNKPLSYNTLTDMGALYPTQLTGDTAIVSFEYTRNSNMGYNHLVSGVPQIVYFTQLWHHYNLSAATPAGLVPVSIGVHTLVNTSGIITKTGIIHALDNSHRLFFYGTKQ